MNDKIKELEKMYDQEKENLERRYKADKLRIEQENEKAEKIKKDNKRTFICDDKNWQKKTQDHVRLKWGKFTVKELIKKLQSFPSDAIVVGPGSDHDYSPVREVYGQLGRFSDGGMIPDQFDMNIECKSDRYDEYGIRTMVCVIE